jgi:hypothetical protein
MYCSNCGKILKEGPNFCETCGKKFSDVITKEVRINNPAESLPEELLKSVRNAGNSVQAIGIASLVFSIIVGFYDYFNGSYDETVLIIVIALASLLYGLLINWGSKLKKDNYENLEDTYKRVKTVIIFTILFIVLSLFLKSYPGLFVLFMLVDLFKAKKKIKNSLQEEN